MKENSKNPKGNCLVKAAIPDPVLNDMADELVSLGVVKHWDGSDPLNPPPSPTINVSTRPKPGSEKCLCIADCRDLIGLHKIQARRFILPSIALVMDLPHVLGQDLFVAKIDVQNAYWSTFLPPTLQQLFTFVIGDETYSLLVLPYGWNASPHAFQHLLKDCLSQAIHDRKVVLLQYLDDILIIALGYATTFMALKQLKEAIVAQGWLLSDSKCSQEPVKSLQWLGKQITVNADHVCVQALESSLVEIAQLLVWVAAKPYPAMVMKSLNGVISWTTIHHRLALPFLNASHQYLALPYGLRPPHPPLATIKQLVHTLEFAAVPAVAPVFLPGGLNNMPCVQLPWIIMDASAVEGSMGIIILWPDLLRDPILQSLPLPAIIKDLGSGGQQLAELYCFKKALRLCKVFEIVRCAFISDSLSSLYGCLKLSCPARLSFRAKILRQIASCVRDHWVTVYTAFIPSIINPADILSRPSKSLLSTTLPALLDTLRRNPNLIAWDTNNWTTHTKRLKSALSFMGIGF